MQGVQGEDRLRNGQKKYKIIGIFLDLLGDYPVLYKSAHL